MRPAQKPNRARGRGGRKSGSGGGGNNINRVYESAGPEGKVRGTPQQIIEKYLTLARDAQTAGDRVAGENFLQHAEHYQRILIQAMGAQGDRRETSQSDEDDDEMAEARPAHQNGQREHEISANGHRHGGDGRSRRDDEAIEESRREEVDREEPRREEPAAAGTGTGTGTGTGAPGDAAPSAASGEPAPVESSERPAGRRRRQRQPAEAPAPAEHEAKSQSIDSLETIESGDGQDDLLVPTEEISKSQPKRRRSPVRAKAAASTSDEDETARTGD